MEETLRPPNPEQSGQEWSIAGGHYDPNDPSKVLDEYKLGQQWDSISFYAPSARNRYWALAVLAYAVELSEIDLAAGPGGKPSSDHVLNEAFVAAAKLVTAEQSVGNLPYLPDDAPVMVAVDTILQTDTHVASDAFAAADVKNFASVIAAVVHQREL